MKTNGACVRSTVCIAAILVAFPLIYSQSLAQGSPTGPDPRARVLYSELVIYRSRVERTGVYYRKLDRLAAAAIERWSDDVLADEMARIDQGHGDRGEDPAAEFLTGRMGVLGETWKLYHDGSRALSEYRGANTPALTREWETDARKVAEAVYDRAQRDNAFATLVNQYLGDALGDITGGPEAILQAAPQFRDHKLLEQLHDLTTAGVSDQQAKQALLDGIAQQLVELRGEVARQRGADEAREAAQQRYEATQRRIDEWETYGNLLARFVGLNDPETGKMLQATVNGFGRAAEVLNRHGAHLISTSAAGANLILISFDLFNGLSGAPTPEVAILEQVATLQKLVLESTQAMMAQFEILNGRFDEINEVLSGIYTEVLQNQRSLSDLQQRVNDLEERLVQSDAFLANQLKAGFARPLNRAIVGAVGYKTNYRPGEYTIDAREFDSLINELFTFATLNASDRVGLDLQHRSFSSEHLVDELARFSTPTNLPYLREALTKYTPALLPTIQIDPEIWLLSAGTLAELVADWPEQQRRLSPDLLVNVRRPGERIPAFMSALRYQNNPSMYGALVDSIASLGVQYVNGVRDEVARLWVSEMQARQRLSHIPSILGVTVDTSTVRSLIPLLSSAAVPRVRIRATGIGGGNLLAPPLISREHMPAVAKIAFDIGLVSFGGELENQNSMNRWPFHVDARSSIAGDAGSFRIISALGPPRPPFCGPPLEISNKTNQELLEIVVGLWFGQCGRSYALNQTAEISRLQNHFESRVTAYFQGLVARSATEFGRSTVGSNELSGMAGFHELLLEAVSLGHPVLTSTSALDTLLFGPAVPGRTSLTRGLFVTRSPAQVRAEIAIWAAETKSALARVLTASADNSNSYLGSDVLQRLKAIEDAMRAGKPYRSPDANQRMLR